MNYHYYCHVHESNCEVAIQLIKIAELIIKEESVFGSGCDSQDYWLDKRIGIE